MRALFGMLVASALALTAVVLVAGYPIGGLDDGWWLLLTSGTGLTLATMLLYQGLVRDR